MGFDGSFVAYQQHCRANIADGSDAAPEHKSGDELFESPRGGGSEEEESPEHSLLVQETSHEHRDGGSYEPSV